MKKTVTDHNSEVLRDFINRIQGIKWLTLAEASEFNEVYLLDHNPRMKEYLMEGVQYLIISLTQMMNINLADQTIVDLDDVISYLNVHFAVGIENGLFVGAKSLEDIMPIENRNKLYKYTFQGIDKNKTLLSEAYNIQADDQYATVENRTFIDNFLKRLDEEGLIDYDSFDLSSFDETNEDKYDESPVKVVRSHPMFEQERKAARKILSDARLRRPKNINIKKNS